MGKITLPIPFKLLHIEERQFSVFEEILEADGPIQQKIGFGFGTNISDHIVVTSFQYQLSKKEQPLLKIEVACYYEIAEKTYKEQLLKEKSIQLPCELAKNLALVTMGTTRGILYSNTKETPFSKFFIGLIDVDKIFKEDIIIKI